MASYIVVKSFIQLAPEGYRLHTYVTQRCSGTDSIEGWAMKANVPTNPTPQGELSCTNYGVDGSDGNSKILENEKFLHAWNYIYKVCTIRQIYVRFQKYMYVTRMVAKIKSFSIIYLYIISYFHLI